jgi:hypothetical protein
VASVIDSVETDVTELCLALPLWEAEEMLPVSELNVMGAWKYWFGIPGMPADGLMVVSGGGEERL